MNTKSGKLGFTLSEMLVVLAIVGTISAMTIPSLMQVTAKREYVSSAKKSYSVLAQSVSLMETQYGPIKFWPWSDSTKIDEMFSKYLNVAKSCGRAPGCFTDVTIKFLDNSGDMNYNTNASLGGLKYKLADGQGVIVIPGDVYHANIGTDLNTSKAKIIVDINGAQGPNQWGRDLFTFFVDQEVGVVPGGTHNSTSRDCENSSQLGTLCAARVLSESKMEY